MERAETIRDQFVCVGCLSSRVYVTRDYRYHVGSGFCFNQKFDTVARDEINSSNALRLHLDCIWTPVV